MKAAILGCLACATLAACATVEGAGRDIQKAGQTIERAAN
jgi:predicted small secreted protein